MQGFPLQIEKQYVRYVERLLNQIDQDVLNQLRKQVDLREFRNDSVEGPAAYTDSFDSFKRWLTGYLAGYQNSKIRKALEKTTLNMVKSVNNFHRNFTKTKLKEATKKEPFFAIMEVPRPNQEQIEGIVKNNVALIMQKFDEYKDTIATTVSEKIRTGTTRKQLIDDLQKATKVTRAKAKFWASDQLGKASADLSRMNQKAAGFEYFIWQTQRDGRVRDSHADLQGEKYRYDDPPVVDGRPLLPGEDYNCFPGDSLVSFDSDVIRGFRHFFTGELTSVITKSNKFFRATPNHPFFTCRGWVAAKNLKESDYLLEISDQGFFMSKNNINHNKLPAQEFFDFINLRCMTERVCGRASQFHGDLVNKNVDIVCMNWGLWDVANSFFRKEFRKLFFTIPFKLRKFFGVCKLSLRKFFSSFYRRGFSPQCGISFFSKILTLFKSHASHSQFIGFRSRATFDPVFEKLFFNKCARDFQIFRNLKFTDSSFIHINYLINTNRVKWVGISHIEKAPYSGFVYNFETETNLLYLDGIASHNCRCFAEPILPDEPGDPPDQKLKDLLTIYSKKAKMKS